MPNESELNCATDDEDESDADRDGFTSTRMYVRSDNAPCGISISPSLFKTKSYLIIESALFRY